MATFGKTTDGSTNSASSATRVWVSTATPSSSGTVTGGTARVWLSATGSANTKMAIYADSSGLPGALLAQSDVVTLTATAEAAVDFTFSGGNQITVSSGTPYWIGVAWDDPGTPSVTVSRDSTAGGRYEQTATAGPTLPNPFGTASANNTGPIDAYITYTPSGSGPTYVATGTYLTEGDSAASAPLAVPAGVQADDVILAIIYKESTAAVTPPSGFTEIGHQAATGAHDHDTYVFWKRATGADSGTYTFTWTGTVWRTGFAMAFRGCVTSGTPVDVYNGATSGSTDVTASPAVSVTTTGADRLLVWLAGTYDLTSWTTPSGFTASAPSGAPASRLTHAGYKAQAAAGSSGSVTTTTTQSFTKTAHLVALLPVPSSTTYSKTGGGAGAGAGVGNRIIVSSKTGGSASSGAGSGAKSVVHAKTGGAVTDGAGSGTKSVVHSKTGGGSSSCASSGARTTVAQKTGGGSSPAAGSGARTTVTQKTGGAVATGAGSGGRIRIAQRTGAAASSAVGVGTRALTSATTHDRTGGAATSAAAVGGYVLEAAVGYVKAGGAVSTGAGTGAQVTVTVTVHAKTGGASAAGAGFGTHTTDTSTTYAKFGGAVAVGTGVATRVLVSPTVHARTGGAAVFAAGTGGRTLQAAAGYVKAGGAVASGAGIALRRIVRDRTGGARAVCTAVGDVLLESPTLHVKTGGAVLVAAGAGARSTASGGRVRLGTPEIGSGVHVMTAVPGIRHRAGTPVVVRPVTSGSPEED